MSDKRWLVGCVYRLWLRDRFEAILSRSVSAALKAKPTLPNHKVVALESKTVMGGITTRGANLKLFTEIKRRKIAQTAVAYSVAGWLLIQLAIALEASLELPSFVDRWVTIVVLAGFPFVILLSWIFEISMKGIRQTKDLEPEDVKPPLSLLALPTVPTPKHSIAVLPFVDMSPNKDQDYLGDGVAEEILNALVQVTPLQVSGRTSSFSFKGKDVDIKQIGADLSVAHVLEGSVRKQGDKVRITAQLIKADDGFHVWSETYDGDLKDIFDLQDSIAKSIVEALELVLDINKVRLVAKLTSSPEAYDLYLRGQRLTNKQDGKGVLKKAIQYLKEAVTLDPDFTRAWASLSMANFWVLEHTAAKRWQNNVKAGRRAAQRAFELDKSYYYSSFSMYLADVVEGNFGNAINRIYDSYSLNPHLPDAKFTWGMLLASIGLVETGSALMSEIIDRDPRSASFVIGSANPYWAMGDVERTKQAYLRAFELGYPYAGIHLAWLLSWEDSNQAGIKFFNRNFASFGEVPTQVLKNPVIRSLYVSAMFRRKKWARYIVKCLVYRVLFTDRAAPSIVGPVNALYLGDAKLFFKLIRKRPHPYLPNALTLLWIPTPESIAIRTHEGFPQFAQDIGLVQAWQTYGWPKWVQPIPGTDGSNLQFAVT